MSGYVEVTGVLSDTAQEALADALSPLQVLGAQVEPDGAGAFRVAVWLTSGDRSRVAEVSAALRDLDAVAVAVRQHEAVDWSAAWRAGLRPFPVGGRWWVDPDPDRPSPAPDGRIRLVVEPRSAFGSGTHESTRLVLIELAERDQSGHRVLDLGTGSGILAVAATARGAASVVGLDIDPMAAWEARRTAATQDPPSRIHVVAGGVDCLGDATFDLVICNMLVTEFGPLLGDLVRVLAPNGAVVLSGMLDGEQAEVEAMLNDIGLEVRDVRELGEWISVVATRQVPGP
ncbi:MAG: 50S ribosomal protein L11 methyltransferase [Holophagae bacterium]|jgi:ribosomal protein L11 methyltransferase